jgi:hypothetical protein
LFSSIKHLLFSVKLRETEAVSCPHSHFSSYATVIVIATGAPKVVNAVSMSKFTVCPPVIVEGVVNVKVPSVEYPEPLFHRTVKVKVWLAVAFAAIVSVRL